PQTLSSVNFVGFSGATWSRQGTIIYAPGAPNGSVLYRISDQGNGDDAPITTLDAAQQESGHFWPHFLPDGRHFLYLAWSADPAKRAIYVGSLDSTERI